CVDAGCPPLAHSHDPAGHVEIVRPGGGVAGEITEVGLGPTCRAWGPQVIAPRHLAGVVDAHAGRAGRRPGLPVEDARVPDHLPDVVPVVSVGVDAVNGEVTARCPAVFHFFHVLPARLEPGLRAGTTGGW